MYRESSRSFAASDRSFPDSCDRTELRSLTPRPLRVVVNGDASWCGAEYRVSRHIDRVGLRSEAAHGHVKKDMFEETCT